MTNFHLPGRCPTTSFPSLPDFVIQVGVPEPGGQAGNGKVAKPDFFYLYPAGHNDENRRMKNITDYQGDFQYENGILQFIAQPEGYIYKDATGYRYVYQYKDHLGNNRLSFMRNAGTVAIVKETNYYPFGLTQKGYNNLTTSLGSAGAKKYQYNGKELQDDYGLDLYDYGARFYDAGLGRWFVEDPMAEKATSWTPYRYAFDNPVNITDPDGMFESTHTDKDGNVVAVYDDGDLGVYKHKGNTKQAKAEVEKNYSKDNPSAGGKKMGETWTSLGFANFEVYQKSKGKTIIPGKGAKIEFSSNWATKKVNGILGKSPTALGYGIKARSGHTWDIKKHTPNGNVYYGSKLYGKYASARDAGNFAAGAVEQLSSISNYVIDYGYGVYNESNNSVLGSVGIIAKDLFNLSVMPGMGEVNIVTTIVAGENPLSKKGIEAGKDYIKNK